METRSEITQHLNKVTLWQFFVGLRIFAAASCHRSRVIMTREVRKAIRNKVKGLAKVRECSVSGKAIGERVKITLRAKDAQRLFYYIC